MLTAPSTPLDSFLFLPNYYDSHKDAAAFLAQLASVNRMLTVRRGEDGFVIIIM